ncbi:MAG TPA: hypothetical protein VGH20_05145 [Myxococcales bacterium]|jgi:hypothetical protein
MPFRRSRIFFCLFGAYLLLAAGIRVSWFVRGGLSGPEFGTPLFDYISLAVIGLSGVLLAASSGQAHDHKRVGARALAGAALFLAQEACALAIAWHWHPQNPAVGAYRSGVLISRSLHTALGAGAVVQALRVLLAARADSERASVVEESRGGSVPRNPPCPPQFESQPGRRSAR